MKNIKHIIILAICLVLIGVILFTSKDEKLGFATSYYPPSVDFKRAVEQTLNERFDDYIYDSLWKKTFHFTSFFESLDGWGESNVGTSSDATVADDQVTMATDVGLNDRVSLFKQPNQQGLITFSQPSRFRSRIQLATTTAQTAYVTVGNVSGSAQGYGFLIVNNSLRGVTHSGSVLSSTTLQSLTAGQEYSIEARYEPNKGVSFFVDDVTTTTTIREVGSISATLPSANRVVNDLFAYFFIRNDAGASKTMYVSMFEYLQKRDVLK